MGNTDNFTNKENIKKIDWVDSEIRAELSTLGGNVESFYEIKQDSIEFKDDVVKKYLVKLRDEVNDMDTKAAWQHLASKENNAAWIMAVQIALEKLGYDVGKIDGILGGDTRNGVLWFQTQCELEGKDGLPGKETISKLCEALEKPNKFVAKQESKPAGGSTTSSGMSASVAESTPATGSAPDAPAETEKRTKDVIGNIKKEGDKEKNKDKEKKVSEATFGTFVSVVKDVFKSMGIGVYIPQSYNTSAGVYSINPDYLHNPLYKPSLLMKDGSILNFDANFHDYIAEDGTFNEDKLRNKLQSLVDATDFVSKIRGKKYTYSDLFGDKKKTLSDIAFFNKFKNQELEIDSIKNYTRCGAESMNLHLDIAGSDAKWCDQTIKYKDLKIDGKYSEEALKQQLVKIVTKIEKDHF